MNTTKYPLTVRELGEMAEEQGVTAARLLEVLGPIPMPPKSYTLAPGSDLRWIGEETMNRNWIITPAWTWNSTGGAHSLELWTANHEPPRYANLSSADAFDLAADLITAARAVETAGTTVTDTTGGMD
jgi:hypothetical protein